jgi:3',5'-cyclic AMP phosphodiesterase CpdA
MAMKTVVHISDLHFGATDEKVCRALAEEILAVSPDVLAISGDLTQRARARQFQDFCEYAAGFPMPKIVVPGNHDVPLFDVARRFFSPLGRFRSIVEDDAFPEYEDDEIHVLGANTAHGWTISGGKLDEDAVREIARRLARVSPTKTRFLVCHHPLHLGEDGEKAGWVGGLERIRERVDLVLTGHLHQSASEVARIPSPDPGTPQLEILLLRAGTAMSSRTRGETNAFNVIRVDRRRIEVEVRRWERDAFAPVRSVPIRLPEARA